MKIGDKVKTKTEKYGIPRGSVGYIGEKWYDYVKDVIMPTYKFISENENDYQGWFFEHELYLMEDDMNKEKMIPKEVYEGLLQMKTICIMHTTDNGQCMINCPFVDISKKLNNETDFCMIKDSKPSDIKFEVKTNYYISKGD